MCDTILLYYKLSKMYDIKKGCIISGNFMEMEYIYCIYLQSWEEGFAEDRIEGIVHQMELSMKRDSENFGLSLLHSCLPPYLHGASLTDICRFQEHINRIKAYGEWRALLQANFLDNPHRLALVMEPSSSYQRERQAREDQLLAERVSALSERDKQSLYE